MSAPAVTVEGLNPLYKVCDEHTLVAVLPNGWLQVLHASVLRGAIWEALPAAKHPVSYRTFRQATMADFDALRVVVPCDLQLK